MFEQVCRKVSLKVHTSSTPQSIVQVQGLPDTIDPGNPLKSDAIVFCFGGSRDSDAFLHGLLEDIWFGDLDV